MSSATSFDAARYEGLRGAALADLEAKIGSLNPGDLSRMKAILEKYVYGSNVYLAK